MKSETFESGADGQFILETHELTKRFGQLTAVDRLTIALKPGDMFGLLGPNGAGKITVIKMLTTLLRPSAGTASIVGLDITLEEDCFRMLFHKYGFRTGCLCEAYGFGSRVLESLVKPLRENNCPMRKEERKGAK